MDEVLLMKFGGGEGAGIGSLWIINKYKSGAMDFF
jgi:hypothetical protein